MSKPSKSAVPIFVVATLIVCLVLALVASAVVESDENETWSGWVQAIGSIGAILVGWIVVVWQREEEDERALADRQDIASVVGWRIFTQIVYVMVAIQGEFVSLKAHRHAMRDRGLTQSNPPFGRLALPDVLVSAWSEFRHFPGEIGPTLAQALGQVETYNEASKINHQVTLEFIEDQQRMLFTMYRSLRGAHNDLSEFLEQDRLQRQGKTLRP